MITNPYPIFLDLDGSALESGKIYIGVPNGNPEITTDQVPVFWDADLSIPAAQPIATLGGYPLRAGTPSRFYTKEPTYSIAVRNAAKKLVFYDADANSDITVPEDGGDHAEPVATQQAAVAGDWGALPNLRRKIAAAQYHDNDAPPVVIRIAGIGSSNMANTNGTLAGPGNSPVELFLAALKMELDPADVCVWDFQNFGINGSGAINYFQVLTSQEAQTPQQRVAAYKPDLVLECYKTNDASATGYNGSTTRPGFSIYTKRIIDDLYAKGIDYVGMTVPHPHVVKSSTPGPNGMSGLRVHPAVGIAYPTPSFAVGQLGGAFANKTFTFSAANKTVTSAEAGLFKNAAYGFGIAAGKRIYIAKEDFSADPNNGGYYRISAVDGPGTVITLDEEYDIDIPNAAFINTRPATLTDATTKNIIQRIDIDASTELRPTIAEAVQDYSVYGDDRTVPVLTRFLDINNDARRLVAQMDRPATSIDVEAYWFPAVLEKGEDYYYASTEVVHWNANAAQEVLLPAFRDWARSLGPVQRAVAAKAPDYQRGLIVRPDADANVERPLLRADGPLDIQTPRGGAFYRRGSDTLQNAVSTDKGVEIARSYPIRSSIANQPPGYDGGPGGRGDRVSRRTFESWAVNIQIFALTYIDLVVPPRHFVKATIRSVNAFRGTQIHEVYGTLFGTTLSAMVTEKILGPTPNVPTPANVVTVTVNADRIRITPDVVDGTLMHWTVEIVSMDYYAEGTPAEDAVLYGFEPS